MKVTLSMFRTIFFFASAINDLIFSRSALLSSPSTMRPSSATTDTPSTSRVVIFKATLFSSSSEKDPAATRAGALKNSLIVVRARHVIAADGTDQLAAARFQALRADGTKPRSVFEAGRLVASGLRRFNPGSRRPWWRKAGGGRE